ncbi:MAG: LacI family DNA-binding transcriptional regulator [Paracoccus sp. (in: a-proteobacteria)]|nr:LacI family DNA-binding transcriptional regulator [Paracoccus sp. (in: a-proteobacteria)]
MGGWLVDDKRGRVTIRDVAEAAGVDRSTVSRAFTRPQMIRPETTEHVLSVAKRMGYSPNRLARALSTGRAANLALVVHDLTNPFIPRLIMGVQREADRSGYCIFIGNADENPRDEARLMSRFAGQVEGTILVSSRLDPETVEGFARSGPVILVNRDLAGLPRVLVDYTRGVSQAVRHLTGLGHRRIAYVGGPESSWSNSVRLDAVRDAIAAEGGELVLVPAGKASFHAGLGMAEPILGSGTTAAIAFDDILAQGILAGLHARGVDVPRQYSLIGCDDILGEMTHPALTSITTRAEDTGSAAVRLMIDRIATPDAVPERHLLTTHLVLRRTTAPAPKAAPG